MLDIIRRDNAEEGSMKTGLLTSAGLPAAIVQGWAEPHYLQSFGLMPAGTVIVYTAKNRAELEICYSLFFESYYFGCNLVREKAVQTTRPELPDSKIAEQCGRVDLAGSDLQVTGCRNNSKAAA
jgi:hypothetical protein